MNVCGGTYRRIPAFTQDPLACSSSQGLCAGYHPLGAMDGASPAGERHKVRVLLGVDGSGVKRHFAGWLLAANFVE